MKADWLKISHFSWLFLLRNKGNEGVVKSRGDLTCVHCFQDYCSDFGTHNVIELMIEERWHTVKVGCFGGMHLF